MRIKSFHLTNYKCFADTGEINLGTGFNVIVGQNNVGKTALIEALSLNFRDQPHRSIAAERNTLVNPQSFLILKYSHDASILKKYLLSLGAFWFSIAPGQEHRYAKVSEIDEIFENNEILFRHQVAQQGNNTTLSIELPGIVPESFAGSNRISVFVSGDKKNFHTIQGGNSGTYLGNAAWNIVQRDTYKFNAERLNISKANFQNVSTLKNNAENLAQVIMKLSSDSPVRFARLNGYIRSLFPSVHHVAVGPNDENLVELRCWIAPTDEERSDLAISLTECGTGIGQVLAMLYVVITADSPQCILIDEPNSFLHPGATKKLIEILRNYQQHQYIVSTHSAEVIRAANPDVILHLRWDGSKSIVSPIDTAKLRSMRDILLDLGVSLGDVFGPDSIIWVEGDTEEQVFPEIVRRLLRRDLMGIAFCGVAATGDFQQPRKKAKLVKRIYEQMSRGLALIPKATSFSFDREGLTVEETAELTADLGANLHFLPRVNFESFLLHPRAIAHVLNSLESFRQNPVAESTIQDWMHRNEADGTLHKNYQNGTLHGQPEWYSTVDGAKLLARLFGEISDQREEFHKVKHSVALANWIIDTEPQWLDGLKEHVARLLPALIRLQ